MKTHYKKEIASLIGKLGRSLNGFADMFHDGKDYLKINELKSIKKTVDDILSLHNNRDEEVDFLREENQRISEKAIDQEKEFIKISEENKKLQIKLNDQKMFIQRIIFVFPQIIEKISVDELNEKFGKETIDRIKNNKYNAYKKAA